MADFLETYKPAIDGKLATAVGYLTTEWAGAQMFLVRVLAELMVGRSLDADKAGEFTHAMTIVGLDARPLIGLVRSMARTRLEPAVAGSVGEILDRMETAKGLRDLVDHCIWELDRESGKLFAVALRTVGKVKQTRRHIPLSEIFDQIAVLHDCANRMLAHLHGAGYMKDYASSAERPY